MPPLETGNMSSGQTGYSLLFGTPRAGMLADLAHNNSVSAISAADLPYGVGVISTSTEGSVALPSGGSDVFAGVVISTMNREAIRDSSAPHYVAGEPVPVLKHGKVWVYVEEAVDETSPVYCRYTANSTLTPGDFRKDADSSKAFAVSNAKFGSKTTGAGYAILIINIP